MRRFLYSLFFITLLFALSYPYLKIAQKNKVVIREASFSRPEASVKGFKAQRKSKEDAVKEEGRFERIGEKIVYGVKLGKVSLGQAVFRQLSRAELEGRAVSLMAFETKLVRFSDTEKIYSDRDTFLPLKVERSISNWPLSEQIEEYYDQKEFTLTIIKNNGRKAVPLTIKKDGPIHNAIMLPFYVRRAAKLDIGWSMTVNLPNQRFEMRLSGVEDTLVPAGNFRAYHFESQPKKFEVWISADERRIPLKIKGAGALGYILVMKEYSPGLSEGS